MISGKELQKTSFVRWVKPDGRCIPLYPCYNDQDEWEMWIPHGDELVRFLGEPVEGFYLAKQAVKEQDAYFRFFDFFVKRAFFPDISVNLSRIQSDIHNLAASIEKFDLYCELNLKERIVRPSRYPSTDLEFIISTCRSIFDLGQEVIAALLKRCTFNGVKCRRLPSSFREMLAKKNELLEVEEVVKKWIIPVPLAAAYVSSAVFFMWLRCYRDRIVHGGSDVGLIFYTERGLAISKGERIFSEVSIWNEDNTVHENLGSLRTLVAHIVLQTLLSLERFAEVLESLLKPPYDIIPNYHVYISGRHVKTLHELPSYKKEQAWYK